MAARRPSEREVRAFAALDNTIRYKAPIWAPQFRAAADDLKAELDSLRAELDAKEAQDG